MSGIAEERPAGLGVEKKAGFQAFIRREPLGVVLVLAPWNYPYLASVNAVIPALMAGAGAVLYDSRQNPPCSRRHPVAFRNAAPFPIARLHGLHHPDDSACMNWDV